MHVVYLRHPNIKIVNVATWNPSTMMTALYFNGNVMLVNIARSNVAIIKIPLIYF